jgi:hypothetical protein
MGFCQSSVITSLEKAGVRYNFSISLNFKLDLYSEIS